MMGAIKGKNTQPEIMLRKYLHAHGFRFRIHARTLPGSPDLVLPKYKLVIFVHGCFWHRHQGCKLAYMPASNSKTWGEKFAATRHRDQKHIATLLHEGWRVFIVWECGLTKSKSQPDLSWLPNKIVDLNVRFLDWPVMLTNECEYQDAEKI